MLLCWSALDLKQWNIWPLSSTACVVCHDVPTVRDKYKPPLSGHLGRVMAGLFLYCGDDSGVSPTLRCRIKVKFGQSNAGPQVALGNHHRSAPVAPGAK